MSLGLFTKFHVLTGRVQPNVGFGVAYVNRRYSELRDAMTGIPYTGSQSDLTSQALDYGMSAGIEFAASENLTLGLEYRYMANLTYKYSDEVLNTPAYRQSYGDWKPLEERNSDFFGFILKYLF